ncbi:MAG: SusC/RagA family TonB-linked outer membrane protein [Saprospiraceae bacterium]|nr:MAG: SusC/RagA family TonB-linked outer membrane protein [Saprospiraceae bacterium]
MKRKITNSLIFLFTMLLLNPSFVSAEDSLLEQVISGIVTDQDGEPLIGVNVVAENTAIGTATDYDGAFRLEVPDGTTNLVFTYTGYLEQVVEIKGQSTINVVMRTDVAILDEVVVVGYGKQKKSDITGAVSTVNVDEIQKIPTADVATALQGQAAGVNVAAATGAPGGNPVIRIRGLGTIGNNNPLFVIDGIPGDLSYINPADIESINVLRDASAATIYGARASNGVVIVTTKRGKTGAPRVSLNTYVATHSLTNNVEMANKAQYNQIMKEARENGGDDPLEYTLNDNQYADTDWADAYIKDAFEQKYDLGISGGTEEMSYFFSGGYFKNSGTVINTDFARYNARLNLDFKLLDGRLSIAPGIGYTRDNSNNIFEPTGGGNASFSPFLYAFSAIPHKEIYDVNSSNGFAEPDPGLGSGNPIGERSLETDQNQDDYLQFNLAAELKILEGLTYQFQFGYNTENTYNYYHLPAYSFGPQATVEDPYISETRARLNAWTLNNVLNYQNSFGEHNIGIMGGISREKSEFRSVGGVNRKLPSNSLEALSAGIGDEASFGFNSTSTLQSYFGRLNYNYGNKYFVQASLRRDGSSRFAADNKYGNFYSISLGWGLHHEDFFNVDFISEFKPRFSYGTLGNQNIGDHLFLARIASGGAQLNYPFGQEMRQEIVVGAINTSLPTPDIKWEETTTTNFGVDLGFMDDRWLLTFDYFTSKTEDMLVSVPVPATSGITTFPLTNGGEMENKGWELSTTYRQKKGDFRFDITANLSASKNKITKLGFADESFTEGYIEFVNFPTTRTEVGGEIGRFYIFQTDGIFQSQAEVDAHAIQPNAAPGDLKFVDTNSDGVLDDDDKVFFDSGLPKLEYGLTFNAYYKNFDLTLFFQGTQGNNMYNGMKMWLYRTDRIENVSADLVNAWSPTNTGSSIPRNVSTDPNSNIRPSDYFLEDGSYLRLRNLQIGYTLPTELVNKVAISKARIYISAYNLLTITDYSGFDPGISNSGLFTRGVDRGFYPLTKSFVVGINLGF